MRLTSLGAGAGKISSDNVISGVFFAPGQRRVRETERVWEKFHHKCIIKIGHSALYCCATRRKKWVLDFQSYEISETNWKLGWEDYYENKRDETEKSIKELIEKRITGGGGGLSSAQKGTVRKCLNDTIAQVINRAWVDKDVGDVLYKICDSVSFKEVSGNSRAAESRAQPKGVGLGGGLSPLHNPTNFHR